MPVKIISAAITSTSLQTVSLTRKRGLQAALIPQSNVLTTLGIGTLIAGAINAVSRVTTALTAIRYVPPVIIYPPHPLYPIVAFDPILATTMINLVPAGCLGVIPLDMRFAGMMAALVAQVSMSQDFGLRGWVSALPGGLSALWPLPDSFPLMRFTPRTLVLYHHGLFPPDNVILVPTVPQMYFLNVLNLTSSPAGFTFAQTLLT